MKHKNLIITNIQRMCFHDGPGIRTTVFMKGCNLHCPWCSNPENINFAVESYNKNGIQGIYGREYMPEELEQILLKDQNFWGTEGGVTFSGGEPLMQSEALEYILERLKKLNVHTALETALFIPSENLRRVLNYIDIAIVDIKILEPEVCSEILGGNLAVYKENIQLLYESGRLRLFRIPCCNEYTFTDNNKELLIDFLRQYRDIPVQLFAIHRLGEKKYQSLGRFMWKGEKVRGKSLEEFCDVLKKLRINAEVISI